MFLDTQNIEYFQTSPYRIFRINKIFDDQFSAGLTASFPSVTDQSWTVIPKGNKKYFNNEKEEFFDFLSQCDIWRQVYEFFAKDETIDFLYNLVKSGNEQRQSYQKKKWCISHDINLPFQNTRFRRAKIRLKNRLSSNTQVRYGFEFSSLGEGASIPPHTDAESKLLSLLLYFPRDDAPAGPVGTEFYAPKKGHSWSQGWNSGLLGEEEKNRFFETHEMFYQTDFVRNVLFGFVKSDVSWHGLKAIEKKYTPRQCVVINYYVDD